MKSDYRFLIGRDFCVGAKVYTVHAVAWLEDYALVEANVKSAHEGASNVQRFPLNQVIQWLLVEEEIELFNPNFLGASGS